MPHISFKLSKRTILFAALSTTLEWFDFTIYIFIVPIISKIFFPVHNALVSIISAFGLFAAGYLMRPIGGYFSEIWAIKQVGKKSL